MEQEGDPLSLPPTFLSLFFFLLEVPFSLSPKKEQ